MIGFLLSSFTSKIIYRLIFLKLFYIAQNRVHWIRLIQSNRVNIQLLAVSTRVSVVTPSANTWSPIIAIRGKAQQTEQNINNNITQCILMFMIEIKLKPSDIEAFGIDFIICNFLRKDLQLSFI
jgi:hypothetical protein